MSDQYVGEIRMFAGNYAPEGWAFCDGGMLSITGNEALFAVIGTTYGGDGRTTFALPDLRGRIPIHTGKGPLLATTYALGQKGGTETVTLTTSQLPQHTHTVNAQSAAGTINSPTNAFWAGSTINQYSTSASDGVMNSSTISSVGGGQSHNNVMQFLTVSFIIALQGIFPVSE